MKNRKYQIFLVFLSICDVAFCTQLDVSGGKKNACGSDGVCNCYSKKHWGFEVDCYGSIYDIPRNIPLNTSALLVSKTKISEIPANAFRGLSRISSLSLINNKISLLQDASFHGIPALTFLSLDGNNLIELPEKVFVGLPSLKSLNLQSNNLQQLKQDVFQQLFNMTVLSLGDNSIQMLSEGMFKQLPNLEILKLEQNNIRFLLKRQFDGLSKLFLLYLIDNQLRELTENVFDGLKSLEYLDLSNNMLTKLYVGCFHGLGKLQFLDLHNNQLQSLPSNLFDELSSLTNLNLKDNQIRNLRNGTFKGLSSLYRLNLSCNSIEKIEEGSLSDLKNLTLLDLSVNEMEDIPNNVLNVLQSLESLYLEKNKINTLRKGNYDGLSSVLLFDLSNNNISNIETGIFNRTDANSLQTLFLQKNQITIIHRDTFIGLDKLELLCLFSNQIHTIEDESFFLRHLQSVYLFQNNLINITGNPFRSNIMKELHLYRNKIRFFDPKAIMAIPIKCNIYINCEALCTLPVNSNHRKIKCVSPSSLPPTLGDHFVANALKVDGFNCTKIPIIDHFSCVPCGAGTYGDTTLGGCLPCPVGGFYQDQIAQAVPSQSNRSMPCKLCNKGTYVKDGHGKSVKDCKVCPEGTNQTIDAYYRACYCKDRYARKDRYGACYLCQDEGLDCTGEYQALRPGYMWNWSIPNANLSHYKEFAENLRTYLDTHTLPAKYTGELPNVFECPRNENCPNDQDSIAGNCAVGYTGWLCTNCDSGYYSVLSLCVTCPSLIILVIECCAFFLVCVLTCLLLSWQIKRTTDRNANTRSVVDVIIARIKILLGFYQVVGEMLTSLHDIKWTGPLVIMGKFISAFEINVLRLFVRPRCFDERFDLNPKVQFIIGALSPVVIALVPFMFYQTKKLYSYIRYPRPHRVSFRPHFDSMRSCLFACVAVLWFIIYPPVCSVIFSVYPMSCKSFALDQNETYIIKRLLSDFDVDCAGLRIYHIFAFLLTVTYVIAFPASLLYILCKSYLYPVTAVVQRDNVATEINRISTPITTPTAPAWLSFLTENYKTNFWYWEIVELTRKVTQTLLITVFGWEHRLTVIITTCISVIFLLLHARYRPMKSSYEQSLQMLSLTVIFFNVVVAANYLPDEHEDTVSVILALLNILVLVIVLVEFLVTITVHLKHPVTLCLSSTMSMVKRERGETTNG